MQTCNPNSLAWFVWKIFKIYKFGFEINYLNVKPKLFKIKVDVAKLTFPNRLPFLTEDLKINAVISLSH